VLRALGNELQNNTLDLGEKNKIINSFKKIIE